MPLNKFQTAFSAASMLVAAAAPAQAEESQRFSIVNILEGQDADLQNTSMDTSTGEVIYRVASKINFDKSVPGGCQVSVQKGEIINGEPGQTTQTEVLPLGAISFPIEFYSSKQKLLFQTSMICTETMVQNIRTRVLYIIVDWKPTPDQKSVDPET